MHRYGAYIIARIRQYSVKPFDRLFTDWAHRHKGLTNIDFVIHEQYQVN